MHPKEIHYSGKPVSEADKALIILHGRNAPAAGIMAIESELPLRDFAIIAPEAYNNSWYPLSFMAPVEQNEPWLSSALATLENLEKELNEKGITSENIFFFGFSQGACLSLEYVTRNAKRYAGVAAIIGGLIGEHINTGNYITNFDQTPILLATSNPDPHVPLSRVKRTEEVLIQKNAQVKLRVFENAGHYILPEELSLVQELLEGRG